MSESAPASPAVASFDPVEWTKKIEALEKANEILKTKCFDLETEAVKKHNEASSARGDAKGLRTEVVRLKEIVEKSDNLKELERLRAEVKSLHQKISEKDQKYGKEAASSEAKVQELSGRASRAEGKFQALESTATMMARSRDKAIAAEAEMRLERDKIQERLTLNILDLEAAAKELVQLRIAQKAATKEGGR